MRKVAAAVALVVALGGALGACGIPEEAKPRTVDDRDVPFGLLDASTTTSLP